MRNVRTKLAVLLAAVMIICSVALTGCQSKLVPADQVVGAMYELTVKENATPMKDLLGFASEDDVRASLLTDDYEEMSDMFKNEFSGMGIEFTDEEVAEMSDTMSKLLNKLSYTAEIQEEGKDETTVLLKVTGYSSDDMNQIMTDLMTEIQTNMDEETLTALMTGDEEATMALMQDVIKQVIAKFGEMEPTTETTDVTVKCEKMKVEVSGKEKVSWMPSDMDKFVDDLENASFK